MTNQSEPQANEGQPPRSVARRPRAFGFPDLFGEMDRLWETILPSPWRAFGLQGRQQLIPAIDVFEQEGKLHVHAELPGLKLADITVELGDDVLTISGEKKDEREVKEDNYHRTERSYGKFRRQVGLPAGADVDHVEAKFKDGVLEIEIPVKGTVAATKKVEIKAAE